MAIIPLDFNGVEAFDNLPLGKYFGQIDKVERRPAGDPSKSDQIMVSYLVTDGELVGRKSSEFLSLSPKAAFRLKKWFDRFGDANEITGLEYDDDTNLLVDPDFVGIDVIFEVYQDPKLYQGEVQVRTRLTEVLEEAPAAPAPAPAPVRASAPPRRAAAAPAAAPAAALPNQVEDGEIESGPEEEEDEPQGAEPEPAPVAPAPRRFAARPAAAAATGPARRTLR